MQPLSGNHIRTLRENLRLPALNRRRAFGCVGAFLQDLFPEKFRKFAKHSKPGPKLSLTVEIASFKLKSSLITKTVHCWNVQPEIQERRHETANKLWILLIDTARTSAGCFELETRRTKSLADVALRDWTKSCVHARL